MEIGKDKFAIVEYTVRLKDGSWVKGDDQSPVSLNFIAGYAQILPALEQRLLGMEQGQEAEFVIPAREAFGPYDEGLVRTRNLLDFPEGRELSAGKWVIATNPDTQAQYSYLVRDKTAESIVLDFNHPLAGKDLFYRVKIVFVRSALEEELEYLRPCEHGPEAGSAAGEA